MGICSAQPNCTVPDNYIVPFDADPDIAGTGVLAAFFIGVWSTYIIIAWGYFFNDRISDDCLSDFDRWIRHGSLTLPNHIRQWIFKKEAQKWTGSSTALIKICLMISDQQLVIGTAMLLIGFITHCNIPQYYFEIIADYGWVTSCVYQTSVMVTYPVFQQKPAMRHWRAAWMTCQAGFIFICQILTYHKDWLFLFGTPTKCIWENMSTGYVKGSQMVQLIVTLSFQVWSYLFAMGVFYPRYVGWTTYFLRAVRYILRLPTRFHVWLSRRWKRPTRLQRGVLATTAFAMLLWGFWWITGYRMSDDSSRVEAMQGSENEWSTGQMMPLLMLALPLFMAVELYWDNTTEKPKPEDTINIPLRTRKRSTIDSLLCSTHSLISSSAASLLSTSYTPRTISSWNLDAREVFESYSHARGLDSDTVDLETWRPSLSGSQEAFFELEYLTIEKLWFRILLVVVSMVVLGGFITGALFGYVI
ncbi:hypothetical protein P168DRAFT_322166 [Aspergillus campestris IBT 28561]|uniref:Uncharacterized protein n=1 Tax=Aspergillus campestris (strain IBT 28561) TaxID=1392248 RepID=A0A2I1CSG8_ASPC2|nr:uncharacterized protein P168DRAFT_322166 [Aspergillus campestris IBT 28561]PKY00557.1 hypothetical protein P168DRAFT_322166 [Aspergillus campestris IBT 28561]